MPDDAAVSPPVVAVQNLTKRYRDGWFGRQSVDALRGVTFRVQPGEIFGLIGPNGAGKTTLIKVLLGIVRHWEGNATLLGRPAGDRLGRQRVGYLPEGHRIPRHLTGNTALEYYGQLSRLSARTIRERRQPLLQRLGLSRAADRSVKGYSKGMLQRLGLAQALLHEPDLLFLDEPTDGVDPRGRAEIRDFLLELKSAGKTIFINSHQLQELELVCTRVAMLAAGQLRFIGTLEEATHQQDEVEFRLRGEALTIAAAVTRSVDAVQSRPDGTRTIKLSVADQSEVDRTIDQLRSAGISVVSLTRSRRSLEQAFLKLVSPSSDGE
ncbi:MAG: ABC transporter ATP-binding protein [Planctomycetaceae bacterium]